MFCFNPRAWRLCGNVRHLFMPRVAGGVTKAASRRCHRASPGPAASEMLIVSLSRPPCLSFPLRSWEFLDPPPCLLRGGSAGCPQRCGAVTGAGHGPVLAAVALCRIGTKLVPFGAKGGLGGLGLFQSLHPSAATPRRDCGVVTRRDQGSSLVSQCPHFGLTGLQSPGGDATPSLTRGQRTRLSCFPTSNLWVFLLGKTRQVLGLSSFLPG